MKKILSALIVAAIAAGCSSGNQTRAIVDVTKAETITLKKASSQGNIHYMTVKGTGNLEGTAEVVLILEGKPYKTEKLTGNIDFQWSGDWYSDSATIEYKPSSVKSGSLNLQYNFKDH